MVRRVLTAETKGGQTPHDDNRRDGPRFPKLLAF
jgi:hypothetical protein